MAFGLQHRKILSMKTYIRHIKTNLAVNLMVLVGAGVVASGIALAAQEVDPAGQLPSKNMQIKGAAKSAPAQTSSSNKLKLGSALGQLTEISDNDFSPMGGLGGGLTPNMDTVSISASGSLSPAGVAQTVTPDTALPLSAWTTVECNVTTKYFTTVTGNQPTDDVIKTSPSLSLNNNAVSYACPYKTQAHLLNIANSVSMQTKISISHNKNGMSYTYSGSLLYSCTRATKASLWSCS